MIKAMSFSSAVRTPEPCVFTWVSIFGLISAVGVAVCQAVQLRTAPRVAAHCGQNVTLTCDVNSSQQLNIKQFRWLRKGTVCEYERDQTGQELQCETTKTEPSHHRLTLTLINLRPIDAGTYTCRLHSSQGVKNNTTVVEVQECRGNLTHFMNGSLAECSFRGVYPGGVVHWFQGEANLTDSCSTKQEVDQQGLYNVMSMIEVERGNSTQPYNCSLWTPSLRRYHSWMQLPLVKDMGSSGSAAGLKWACLLMEVIMLKLIV
ncbi:selection and upkeep of intraepithelial T-cells protein 2-like [Salarias fasciatus]|uniref:selection and upkeep of intraepithelial T-cells protein 2-like n=1 Tax=Salarias fasciatus TaxID=181472 RepID=UPI0011767441|nr:selection and upkeep of intraepithelial T-cells protein 2-like [Salarias fasciatus]